MLRQRYLCALCLVALTTTLLGCDGVESSTGGGGEGGSDTTTTSITLTNTNTGTTIAPFCAHAGDACSDTEAPCCDQVYCDDAVCNPCKHRFCMGADCQIMTADNGTPCSGDGQCANGHCF